MAKLNIQLCPETGICSVIKDDGTKIDMVGDEVAQLRLASGDTEKVKAILAEIDATFCESLDSEELHQLSEEIE